MKLSAYGAADLLISEAIVTQRYKDSVGVWTIGVGHTKMAGGVDPSLISRTLTVEECLQIFAEDVPKYEKGVNDAVKVAVTQYEFDAMVSFHFNTGGIGRATFVKNLNAGKSRDEVAKGFMNWVTPPSIIGRRTREMNLFRTGVYVPNPKASVYTASGSSVDWGSGKLVAALPLVDPLFTTVLPTPTPEGRPILRNGSKGPSVVEWQQILINDGEKLEATGNFDNLTEWETRAWQSRHELVDDGVVGGKTWGAALSNEP